MSQNYSSSSEDLKSTEYPFIVITPRSTLFESDRYLFVSPTNRSYHQDIFYSGDFREPKLMPSSYG